MFPLVLIDILSTLSFSVSSGKHIILLNASL